MNSRDMWVILKAQDQATRALNSFSRSARSAGNAVRMAQLEAEQATLRASLAQGRLTGMTTNQRQAIQAQIASLEAQQAQLRVNSAQVEEHANKLRGLSNTMRSVSLASYAMGFAITAGAVGGAVAIKNAIDTTIEYDRQVRLTSTQIANFSGNLKEVGDVGLRVANSIGVHFEDIQPALYDLFSSMDINISQAEKLLTGFAKAAVAGQTDIQSVSRGTIGILNSFHLSAEQINHVLDLQFMFIRKGVGTYDEWAKRIGLVSPSAARAGQSLETMMAALASASRMSGVAARAGTAVARAFDAISNAKAVKALKDFGVAAVDAHGNFRPFIDIMSDLRAKLQAIPGDAAKAAKVQEIFAGAGGTIEARRFLNNLLLVGGTLEDLQGIMKDTSNAAGSMDQAYALMADSTAAKSELLRNRWMSMKNALGEALMPIVTKFLDILGKMLGWFNNLSPGTKDMIGKFLALGVAIGLVVGPLLLLLGFLASVVAAFVTAGTTILVVVGVFAALFAALIYAGVVFTTLIKHSSAFRQTMSQIGDAVSRLWSDFIYPTFQKIKDSFEKYIGPPMDKIKDVIETKIMPAFNKFQQLMANAVIPKLAEAGRLISEGAGKAFEYIGWAIDHVVRPALEWFGNWWSEHQKDIEPFIPLIAQVVKWLVILAAVVVGVVVAAFVGPLIAAIGVVAAGFALAIITITSFIKFFQWIGALTVEVANAIKDGFLAAWNAIIQGLQAAWNWIIGLIQANLQFLNGIWQGFWSLFGGLFKAVWDLIVSVVQLGMTSLLFIVLWGVRAVQNLWNFVWSNIGGFVKGVWNGIVDFISSAWSRIVNTAVSWGNRVSSFLSTLWLGIRSIASSAWSLFTSIISDRLQAAQDRVMSVWNGIKSFFSGSGSWLYSAGQNIIQGIIDGIASMVGKVAGAIANVTKTIRDHLPFSPAKRGPLSGSGDPFRAGARISRMVAGGMLSQMDLVSGASSVLMGQFSFNSGLGVQSSSISTSATPPVGSAAAPTAITNNFYVTHPADERTLANEMSWQLENRLGVG